MYFFLAEIEMLKPTLLCKFVDKAVISV